MATVFYRKDRKFWYYLIMVDGKRKRRRGGRTKPEAQRALAEAIKDHHLGVEHPDYDRRITVRRYADDEYLPWAEAHKEPATLKRDKLSVQTWVAHVGNCPLVGINRRMADRFRTKRLRTVEPRTVNLDIGVISHMLTKAVEWEIIPHNPLVGLKRLTENVKEMRWLTSEEIGALMDAVPDRLYAVVVIMLNTGIRKSEMERLEWRDLDLKHEILSVRHKGKKHTKSHRERIVDLNDLAVETLRHHRLAMKARFGKLPLQVFVTEEGTPLVNNFYRDLKDTYAAAGIEGACIHTLRHTFGSHAVMAGMDIPTLQKLMGHADIKTTMKYVHVNRDHMRQAIAKLSIGGKRQAADVIPMTQKRGR